ncbi:MAG: hypothetical protein EP297_02395 [Gammaproteobacteria bacterium]|nr:MAG: hypothetical protein EP297_02395 [Gammaproteobacteria bacterium]
MAPLIGDGENHSALAAYIKLIGSLGALIASYLLMAVGALSLLIAAYHAWNLYINPYSINVFTDAFVQTAFRDQKPDPSDQELYRLMSWPIVVFLLLLLGKIGAWAIEAAVHLLDTIHGKDANPDD